MIKDLVFINYDQNKENQRQNRQTVSKYIGSHYRNRSKPLQRELAVRKQPPQSDSSQPSNSLEATGFDDWLIKDAASGLVPSPVIFAIDPDLADHNTNLLATPLRSVESELPGSISQTTASRETKGNQLLPALPLLTDCSFTSPQAEWARFAFDFQINYILPHVANWGFGPNIYSNLFAQMMVQDQVLFDAVAVSAHGFHTDILLKQVKPSQATLWHRARALSGLQPRMTDDRESTTNTAVLIVFCLLANAARFHNHQEFRMHYKGLQRILKLRGKVEAQCLEDVFACQSIVVLESSEIASATRHTLQDPLSTKLTYPDLPLGTNLGAIASRLPFGLKRLAMEGCLSSEVITILGEIPKADYWVSDYQASELHSSIAQRARFLFHASRSAVERLTCLGIMAFSLRLVIRMHFFPELSFLRRLVRAGQRISRSPERLYHEIRVWVTIIGADLAAPTNDRLRHEARMALADLKMKEPWIKSWADVETAMKKFFWSDSFAAGWKNCWNQATLTHIDAVPALPICSKCRR